MTARDDTSNAQAIGGIKIGVTTDVAGIEIDHSGKSIATSSPPVSEQELAQ